MLFSNVWIFMKLTSGQWCNIQTSNTEFHNLWNIITHMISNWILSHVWEGYVVIDINPL